MTKKPSARELPLDKTVVNGCTPGEAAAAFEKAEQLVAKYELDPETLWWPSTPFGSATSGPDASKAPRVSASGRGRGIGRLAERLIVEQSD